MSGSLTLRVITPDRIVVDTTVSAVKFPALDGSMGILPRHATMVAALDAGALSWTPAGEHGDPGGNHGGDHGHMFVSGGFAEVRAGTVRIVTEASEPASEIDVERAERSAQRARERLRGGGTEISLLEFDQLRAEGALRRALMRKLVAGRARL